MHFVFWNADLTFYEYHRLAILCDLTLSYYCQTEAGERMLLRKDHRGLGRTVQEAVQSEQHALYRDLKEATEPAYRTIRTHALETLYLKETE